MQMPAVQIFKSRLGLSISAVLFWLFPFTAYPHEGDLDSYGCHYDINRRDYHCHQGEFRGRSFDSKIQVMQLLRPQHLDRGLPLPHKVNEEDVTSAEVKTKQEPVASPGEEIRNQSHTASFGAAMRDGKASTEPQTRRAQTKPKPEAAVRKEKTQPTSNPTKTRQQLNEWIVSIRPDGLVIYENMLGERYYVDDNGKKVYVRRKR